MDTRAKIIKIVKRESEKFIKLLAGINGETNSYDFERIFMEALRGFDHDIYQEIAGGGKVSENNRMQLLTSVGEIILDKSHPQGKRI
ncbi:hypothetical protein FACS189435_1710 [Bacteroidia bacterium]|nr:hypothetical protein FACS189435_1710 [Bacteroidia bacterium]